MKLKMSAGMPEYDAYHDLWEFHKTYGHPEDGVDAYWEQMVKAWKVLIDKYKDTIMATVVEYHLQALTSMWHNECKKGGKYHEQL